MKQFLTFLFIWFIPILSNATAKTNTIAGDLVNSLSSRTCNCYFLNSFQKDFTAFNAQDHESTLNFGNNNSSQNELVVQNDQWYQITTVCLLLFTLIFSVYLILQITELRKRGRN